LHRDNNGKPQGRFQVRRVMRVQSGHWLDYDPLALAVLVVGIGVVAVVAVFAI
jgi:hypothetical protein